MYEVQIHLVLILGARLNLVEMWFLVFVVERDSESAPKCVGFGIEQNIESGLDVGITSRSIQLDTSPNMTDPLGLHSTIVHFAGIVRHNLCGL
jgi:hypothetical protein